ncbi:protein LTO1 homolog isoform X2 [Lagenorhynchus albirostris]|uniref:protein LTO1 homolog isoform X2 n=1 Tax=Lagenorhynchus albirostris TaxID=27610 RepID=UPI0028E880B7|nr:protein LTO1 homolog isoform X2 [Lagenorhynchus albirostris]
MAGSQDMFDAVVMADDRFHGEGYQEGYEEGSSLGMIEGRRYGTLHGAKIGSEIGCYQGFALAWRCLLHGCTTEKDRVLGSPCLFPGDTFHVFHRCRNLGHSRMEMSEQGCSRQCG